MIRYVFRSAMGLISFVGLGAAQAMALPVGFPGDGAAQSFAPHKAVLDELAVDFTSIVALDNCSGALVRFESSQPTDKAMVLTNGHCYEGGMPQPGTTVVNRNSSRSFRLLSSDGRSTLATLRAEKVIYSTMTDTDIALYRLNTSFADVKSRYGVDGLTISSQHPEAGMPIRVVSGYWKRIYSCSISKFVWELREAGWTMKDSIRYSQPGCETIGGTSGSPIVHAESREVIGVNNTGNDSGGRCTMNNPCEVDANGQITAQRGASYGQQTYKIYGCLNDANELDLQKAGCELPK